jgi:selenide, water dikinase
VRDGRAAQVAVEQRRRPSKLLLSPDGGGGSGRRRRIHHYAGGVSSVRLTDLTASGGCAAKYSAARLDELLRGFVPAVAEDLLVGLDPADDAAVYRLDDDRAIVFTVDFFPPLVDDPRDFGAIAATNALNDVFAMGGTPLLALSVAAFPEELPTEVVAAVLAGADEAVRAAGALLAGGHTIRDREPKYGLAVVGTVHPDGIWPKSGARPGDTLYLTKPLGTGLVLHGVPRGLAGDEELRAAVRWMTTLNRAAADAVRPSSPSAVTDVTGFGLLGHAHEMALRSGVAIALDAASLPALPGALEVARAGERTGGDGRNREYADVAVASGVAEELVALAYDPQTAGGLLVSLPADRAPVLEARFAAADLFVRRVGRVEDGEGVTVA